MGAVRRQAGSSQTACISRLSYNLPYAQYLIRRTWREEGGRLGTLRILR